MHVDHDCLLDFSFDGLNPKVAAGSTLFANHRAIYSNRHNDASALPQRRLLANCARTK
jgi:hypothetical protein